MFSSKACVLLAVLVKEVGFVGLVVMLLGCVEEPAELVVDAVVVVVAVAVVGGCMMYPLLRLVIVWLKWFLKSSRLVQ